MKRTAILAAAMVCTLGTFSAHAQMPISTDGSDPASWDPHQEALHAAPGNHKVILENSDIRVLSVTVQPGETEHVHHHVWPSVLIITSLPKIIDYSSDGKEQKLPLPDKIEMPLVLKLPPQAAHYVKVDDTKPLHLIRVEFKKGFPAQP